jgi:hypothetical protein
VTQGLGGAATITADVSSTTTRQRRIVQWVVTFVLVPLLPLVLAAIFRAMRETPAPGSLWWCSEVPFFSITLCAAGFLKCRDLATVDVAHKTDVQSFLPWLELLLALDGFMSLVFLSVYYSDTYLTPFSENVRKTSITLNIAFAIFALGLGIMGVLLESAVQSAKEKP